MTRKEYREEAIQAYLLYRMTERETTKGSSISSYPDGKTWDGRQFYIGRAIAQAIARVRHEEGGRWIPRAVDIDGYERISVRSLWRDPDTYVHETPSETQSRLNSAMRHAACADRFGRNDSVSKKTQLYRERKAPFSMLPPRPLPGPGLEACRGIVAVPEPEPSLEVRP